MLPVKINGDGNRFKKELILYGKGRASITVHIETKNAKICIHNSGIIFGVFLFCPKGKRKLAGLFIVCKCHKNCRCTK
jgi:hypothetical protein